MPCHGVVLPDTSLDTGVPIAYFCGARNRTQASLSLLAKHRMVIINKHEGPCINDCLGEFHQHELCTSCNLGEALLGTLRQVKQLSPNVSTGYYQQYCTLNLDDVSPYPLSLYRDSDGNLLWLHTDPGYPSPVIGFDGADTLDIYKEWAANLVATGFVDGTYTDKASVFAADTNKKGTGPRICEYPNGVSPCVGMAPGTLGPWNSSKMEAMHALDQTFGFHMLADGDDDPTGTLSKEANAIM
eukprot:gene2620-3313_t